MRLRGHTCAPCLSINEVHYRRHHDIAEKLRAVYEICGEITWGIIPSDNDSRERAKECGDIPEADENQDPNYDYGDTPTSKREKKEAKRLARAASRSKVITQYEITYIDRIMHSSHGLPSNDSDVPYNAEEVEEIERQLRVSDCWGVALALICQLANQFTVSRPCLQHTGGPQGA